MKWSKFQDEWMRGIEFPLGWLLVSIFFAVIGFAVVVWNLSVMVWGPTGHAP
jgi:hypothetical protein